MKEAKQTSAGLWHFFQERCRSFNTRLALDAPEGKLNFAELFHRAEHLASALSKARCREGEVMVLALPNSIDFIPSFLALCKLSSAIVLVSPKYGASELHMVVNSLRPKAMLAPAAAAGEVKEKLGPLAATVEQIDRSPSAQSIALISLAGFPTLSGQDGFDAATKGTSLIKVTSGSTGGAKGISLTAKQLLAEARNIAVTLDLTPEDRIYAPVPIFHSYGFDLGVLAMLFSGAPLILEEIFVPRKILSKLTAPEITVFLGVPSMYRFLLEATPLNPPDLSRLRYALSCTAPLYPDLIAAFHDTFNVPICQHYGSSETGAATTHIPQAVLDRPASVGVAMKNVELLIVDEQGRPLPTGQTGEVVVRSEAVAGGYAMGPQAEVSPFTDGAFRMGDIGHLDADGFLFLHGRKDALINVGGLKVSPDEVTMVLESCPAVREAAVIGVRDAMGEEIVYAAVALRSALSEKELLAFCSSRLANYKVPRRLDIFEKLPRGPSGKIKIDPPTL